MNRTQQYRAVFLTVIMAISVFAFVVPASVSAVEPSGPSDDTVSASGGPGSNIEVANVSFSTPGNVSNVSVRLDLGTDAAGVDEQDIQNITVELWNSSGFLNASATNTTINANTLGQEGPIGTGWINVTLAGSEDVGPGAGSATGGNFTDINRIVVIAGVNTSDQLGDNPGAIINASIAAYENSSATGFDTGNTTGVINTSATQTVDHGGVAESTNDVIDENQIVNISFNSYEGLDENTVNVSVRNLNVTGSNVTSIVENGQAVGDASFLESTNISSDNRLTFLNVSVPLQEGYYVVNVTSADTDGGTPFNVSANNVSGQFNQDSGNSNIVDMGGKSLKVITDDRGPAAGSNASVSIVALDANDNELIFNDSNVNATGANLRYSFDDPDNTTLFEYAVRGHDGSSPTFNTSLGSNGQYNITHSIQYSQVGDLQITAKDFGGNLSKDSATQTYTASITSVSVTAEDGELTADGSDTERVTLQLLDQNGDPVQRANVGTGFGITSGNQPQAGVQVNDSASSTATNNSGMAWIVYNATNSGFTIEVTGETTNLTTNYDDSAEFDTVPGPVDTGTSSLTLDGAGDQTAKVGSQHTIMVETRDSQDNIIQGVDVEFKANNSDVTFDAATGTTNASGQYATTVTMPETKNDVKLNVTANEFNESATSAAVINVSMEATAATALAFQSDSRTLASSTSTTVTVEAVDEFGNLNESVTPDITLNTSDTSVITINGNEEVTTTATAGTSDFTIDAETDSGSATLTATASGFTNVSDTWSIGIPAQIDVTFDSFVTTSNKQGATTTTTMYAQLQDADGNDLGIQSENVTFAIESGDAAELDQRNSSEDFTINTNESGVASIQVNSTSNTGDTSFFAQSENYSSATGSSTLTTTGPASTVRVTADDSTPSVNTSTDVTVSFRDSSGRNVPRQATVTVTTSATGTFFESNNGQSVKPTIQRQSYGDFSNQVTLNSTQSGETTVRATGGGVTGTSTVTFQAAEGAPTGSVTFNDQTVTNGSTSVTVASANASVDFYVNVSDSDGNVLGTSDTFSSEQTDLSVSLDSELTANQTLTASVHDASDDSELASDDASITISEIPEDAVYEPGSAAADYDNDGDGLIDVGELGSAATDYANGQLSVADLGNVATAYANS